MSGIQNIIGLIPAAGFARRLAPLPCSKEILPIGPWGEEAKAPIKVSGQFVLESMRLAGAHKACIVIRREKWDIPVYFEDGRIVDMKLAYLLTPANNGVPFTLDVAYEFVKDSLVVFGFPDILFKPQTAFIDLYRHLNRTQADLVLGLFRAHQPSKMDMVELDESGGIRRIDIKPSSSTLTYTWIIAVWTPVFTRFLSRFVQTCDTDDLSAEASSHSVNGKEVFLGDVIESAIHAEMKIDKVIFNTGDYLDIGTMKDLVRAPDFTRR